MCVPAQKADNRSKIDRLIDGIDRLNQLLSTLISPGRSEPDYVTDVFARAAAKFEEDRAKQAAEQMKALNAVNAVNTAVANNHAALNNGLNAINAYQDWRSSTTRRKNGMRLPPCVYATDNGTFKVITRLNGKKCHVGTYGTVELAIAALAKAKKQAKR